MTENSVASVFKTLVKVPIVIVVSYLILNIFAFALSYFRILGASYSLQQIIMENNYLPEQEAKSFQVYLKSLETDFLTNITPVVHNIDEPTAYPGWGRDSDGKIIRTGLTNGVWGSNKRVQYGNTTICGIVSDFRALFPWRYDQLTEAGGVEGYNVEDNDITNAGFKTDEELKRDRLYSTAKIDIVHPVIGLQYYTDLE